MPVGEIMIPVLDGSAQAERAEVSRPGHESSPPAERASHTVLHVISCKNGDSTPR